MVVDTARNCAEVSTEASRLGWLISLMESSQACDGSQNIGAADAAPTWWSCYGPLPPRQGLLLAFAEQHC